MRIWYTQRIVGAQCVGLLSQGSVPAEEATKGWQNEDPLQILLSRKDDTAFMPGSRRPEPLGMQDQAGQALWHF